MQIHPTAVIHPDARLGANVTVGPGAVIDEHVTLGANCRVYAHAYLTGFTTIGSDTEIHMGAVVGHLPQDKAFDPETVSHLEIGQRNVIREYVTIHRATKPGAKTVVGDDCFLMAHAHIAHDCEVGDGVIICNNASLAGYVRLGDRAFVSGGVVVHQFCRVGTLCMLGGGCQVGQNVPPYTIVAGRSQIRGINVIGLRRAGIDRESRAAIRDAYRKIFAARGEFEVAMTTLDDAPELGVIATIREFYEDRGRGFVWPPKGRDDIDDDRVR